MNPFRLFLSTSLEEREVTNFMRQPAVADTTISLKVVAMGPSSLTLTRAPADSSAEVTEGDSPGRFNVNLDKPGRYQFRLLVGSVAQVLEVCAFQPSVMDHPGFRTHSSGSIERTEERLSSQQIANVLRAVLSDPSAKRECVEDCLEGGPCRLGGLRGNMLGKAETFIDLARFGA